MGACLLESVNWYVTERTVFISLFRSACCKQSFEIMDNISILLLYFMYNRFNLLRQRLINRRRRRCLVIQQQLTNHRIFLGQNLQVVILALVNAALLENALHERPWTLHRPIIRLYTVYFFASELPWAKVNLRSKDSKLARSDRTFQVKRKVFSLADTSKPIKLICLASFKHGTDRAWDLLRFLCTF